MTLPTNTLLSICQQVARNLGAYRNGTVTGGGTTNLICAAYPFKTSRSNMSSMLFEGVEIRPTSGNENGNARMVDSWAPSTGSFTVGVAWSTGVAASDTFDMFLRGIEYNTIKDAVNKALRERYKLYMVPLTLITDGDCELSTYTSWSESDITGLSITQSKVTTAGLVANGKQALKLLTSASLSDQYIYQMLYAPDHESYIFYMFVKIADGCARMRVCKIINVSGVATDDYIDDADIDEILDPVYTRRGFRFTVPESSQSSTSTPLTTNQMRIQIDVGEETTGLGNEIYLDDIIVLPYGATRLDLPDYISFPEQVRGVYRDANCDNGELLSQVSYVPYRYWRVEPNQASSTHLYRLVVDPPVYTPIYVELALPYDELTLDTSTTTMNRQLIETAATVELLQVLKSRTPDQEAVQWAALHAEWSRKLNILERLHPQPVLFKMQFDSPVDSPEPQFGGSV